MTTWYIIGDGTVVIQVNGSSWYLQWNLFIVYYSMVEARMESIHSMLFNRMSMESIQARTIE